MALSALSAAIFWLACGLVVYHHIVFPLLMRYGARLIRAFREPQSIIPEIPRNKDLPSITIIVPAYNEERFIAGKIKNLNALNYPKAKLKIIVASDGSTDKTVAKARKAIAQCKKNKIELCAYRENIGKSAVLNKVMGSVDSDIVIFSDVSSRVERDILKRFAGHFADPEVGVVCGAYMLDAPAHNGEGAYWDFQIALKRDESTVAEIMGAHGAFYGIRHNAFEPLEEGTINDDFIIPMKVVAKGYRSIYDPAIQVREIEATDFAKDFKRRLRLSQGNMQQLLGLTELFSLKRPAIAFVFASGKGLRALVPFLLAIMVVTSFVLTMLGEAFYGLPLTGLAILMALGLMQLQDSLNCLPKRLHAIAYLATGHMAGLIGSSLYLLQMTQHYKTTTSEKAALPLGFISPAAGTAKRSFDIVVAGFVFVMFAVLFPFIALAIKWDSQGPVFSRQLRVGTRTPTQTKLFMLIKFRTMSYDAEQETGAVWAQRNDARVTRVGQLLRKTRLDEIPQCLNVLQGDMSIVGPRPERPVFFAHLEKEIPYYSERTYGIRPGITGLAQVTVGYDECVEDVRQKVLHDHVYATRLGRLIEWMQTDLSICFRTFAVVVLGKGQ